MPSEEGPGAGTSTSLSTMLPMASLTSTPTSTPCSSSSSSVSSVGAGVTEGRESHLSLHQEGHRDMPQAPYRSEFSTFSSSARKYAHATSAEIRETSEPRLEVCQETRGRTDSRSSHLARKYDTPPSENSSESRAEVRPETRGRTDSRGSHRARKHDSPTSEPRPEVHPETRGRTDSRGSYRSLKHNTPTSGEIRDSSEPRPEVRPETRGRTDSRSSYLARKYDSPTSEPRPEVHPETRGRTDSRSSNRARKHDSPTSEPRPEVHTETRGRTESIASYLERKHDSLTSAETRETSERHEVRPETRGRTDSRTSYRSLKHDPTTSAETRETSEPRPEVRPETRSRTDSRTSYIVRKHDPTTSEPLPEVRPETRGRTSLRASYRSLKHDSPSSGEIRDSSEPRPEVHIETRGRTDSRGSYIVRRHDSPTSALTRETSEPRPEVRPETRGRTDSRASSYSWASLDARTVEAQRVSVSESNETRNLRSETSSSSQPVLLLHTLSSRLPNLNSANLNSQITGLSSSVRQGMSEASLGSSVSSPPLGATSLVASICNTLPSPSLVPAISPARLLRSSPPQGCITHRAFIRSSSPHLSETSWSERSGRLERSAGSNSSSSSSQSSSSSGSSSSEQGRSSSSSESRSSGGSRSSSGRRRGGISNLALTHLASSESVLPHCLHSPPPTYDQLCNPNALPTYQEATQVNSRGNKQHRGSDHQWTVYTVPTQPDDDPLFQETYHNQRFVGIGGGVGLASLAAELSDSEGGYSTILDAIPHEHPRDPRAAPVPVTFLSPFPPRRLRPLAQIIRPPCFTSVCNKALVRKELNRRWPFISGATEDATCPGLIKVQCSSHLTVAHLPDVSRPNEGAGLGSGGLAGDLASLGDNGLNLDLQNLPTGNPSSQIDLESGALTSRVIFYLCGKCVGYDSFDRVNVRAHIDFDCIGTRKPHTELYLILRAVLFVAVVIGVFLWVPYIRI